MTTLVKTTTKVVTAQTGEVWVNNKEIAVCTDCDQTKPILYKFVLGNGKVLSCACADCYSSYYKVA